MSMCRSILEVAAKCLGFHRKAPKASSEGTVLDLSLVRKAQAALDVPPRLLSLTPPSLLQGERPSLLRPGGGEGGFRVVK